MTVRLLSCSAMLLLGWMLRPTVMMAAPSVVATLPPLAGMVRLLDPELAPDCLLGASADPHLMRITPRQAAALRRARLLLRSSGDDGGWRGLAPRAGTVLDLWPDRHHAWLVPAWVRRRLPALADALVRRGLLPAAERDARLARASARLDALEAGWRRLLAPWRERGVIMQHPAWRALMRHFGVAVRAVLEPSHHGEGAGPRRLERALRLLRGSDPPLLLVEESHGNRMIDWLRARVQDARVVRLNALGRCGLPLDRLMADNQSRWPR